MTAERISFCRWLFDNSSTQGVITSSLLVMEMHIPAALGWHAKSNWVKLSQHICAAPRLFTIQTNSTVKNVWNWPWHVPQLPSSASYPISVSFVEAQAIWLFWGYNSKYPVTQKLWKMFASGQSIHLHIMYERSKSLLGHCAPKDFVMTRYSNLFCALMLHRHVQEMRHWFYVWWWLPKYVSDMFLITILLINNTFFKQM